MAHQHMGDGADRLWLASLIDSFEHASQDAIRNAPCDGALLCAAQHYLARSVVVPSVVPDLTPELQEPVGPAAIAR
jgi:hypothetical protein